MCRAESPRRAQLPPVHVDGDDRARAGEPRADDRRRADAAAAEDGDRVAAGDPPVLIAAPIPAITPQPSSPAAVAGAAGSTFVHCAAATSVFSARAPIPSAGVRTVPSVSVIRWVALWVAKQYQGRPRAQARQLPQTARQFRITKSPGATSVTPAPTVLTRPAASCPSRNG